MSGARPHFEALITPHRSLGPAGMRRLVGFILLLSGSISVGLFMIGAWPVVGFNGAEVGLALVLLTRNAREKRRMERLVLHEDGLLVQRSDARGRVTSSRRLNVAWLQAVLEERPGRAPALLLVERGRRLEVGAELGEAEKRHLAAALRGALYRLRNPVFQNPQLQ